MGHAAAAATGRERTMSACDFIDRLRKDDHKKAPREYSFDEAVGWEIGFTAGWVAALDAVEAALQGSIIIEPCGTCEGKRTEHIEVTTPPFEDSGDYPCPDCVTGYSDEIEDALVDAIGGWFFHKYHDQTGYEAALELMQVALRAVAELGET